MKFKISFRMDSSASVGSVLPKLTSDTNHQNNLQKWELPKVSKKQVYQKSMFELKKNYSIQTTERIISLNNMLESIRLFDQQAVRRYREKYKYLHVGLVQVGVKPLTREGFNTSILLCLRDKRLLDFNQSLLAVLQSNLDDGPVYFNCYPDIMFFLNDPNVWNSLALNIRLQNLEMNETSFPVVLIYRVYFKCLINPFNTAAKKSSCFDKTLIFQTKVRRLSADVPRVIKWSEVEFPEEWKVREENPPENKQAGSNRQIQNPAGSTRIVFPQRNNREPSVLVFSG